MIYAGVDVGGMSIKCCLATEEGKILAKGSFKTKAGLTCAMMAEETASYIKSLAEKANIPEEEICAVGMGTPGTVDGKKGVIVYSNNIRLEHAPIVKEMKKYFTCPVFVDNDANVAALGEAVFGAGKGLSDVVLVTLGTGVGTGIVVNGKMITGKGGAGAEGGRAPRGPPATPSRPSTPSRRVAERGRSASRAAHPPRRRAPISRTSRVFRPRFPDTMTRLSCFQGVKYAFSRPRLSTDIISNFASCGRVGQSGMYRGDTTKRAEDLV